MGLNTPGHAYTGIMLVLTRAWDGSQYPWPCLHWDYAGPLQGHGMGLNAPGHAYTGILLVLTRAWDGSQCPWPRLHRDYAGPLQGHGMGLNVPGHAYIGIMLVPYNGMGWVSMSLATPTLGLC